MILYWQYPSGLHSNGFSLVRHIVNLRKITKNNKYLKKELLKPTKFMLKRF